MKKIVLLLGIIGLSLGMTACNSKSETLYRGLGAYMNYTTPYIIHSDGTKLTLTNSQKPTIDPSEIRSFCSYIYTMPEGMGETGPGKTVPIILTDFSYFRTINPKSEGSTNYKDPIISLTTEKFIGISNNFIYFLPRVFVYTDNKTGSNSFAEGDFAVEIADELIPGEKNDTVSMTFKYFANRAQDEKSYEWRYANLAVDLDDVVMNFTELNLDGDKTYIIKFNYLAYDGSSYDDEKAKSDFYLLNWTPNDPYGEKNKEK